MIIGLTDRQLAIVLESARPLAAEKRSLYLQRVTAMLRYRRAGRGFNDEDVADVAALARTGLVRETNDAA